MSRFDERIARGLARVSEQTAVTVILRRASSETTDVPATVGRTESRNGDSEGVQVKQRHRDYLIDAAEYVIDGFATDPRAGDEIDQTIGGTLRRFEVHPITPADAAWSWSDGNRTRYRIHTREIDASE